MKIERKLKYGTFGWDDETKMFTVEYKGQSIKLSKVYAFSFLRFAFSMAQRNWFRKLDKPKTNKKPLVICDKQIKETRFDVNQFILPNCEEFVKDKVLDKSWRSSNFGIWLLYAFFGFDLIIYLLAIPKFLEKSNELDLWHI